MDGLFNQRGDVLKTPRKSARGQGPHLERLSEHLRQLQNDLTSDKVARESASKDALGAGTPTSRGKTPRHLTPRATNITPRNISNQGLQSEINRLRRDLVTEIESRQAAAERALISADEAAAAAQWAEAVTHENEKLHQLIDMQRAIINDLQGGHPVASPMASQAQNLSNLALAAQGTSQQACELRDSLLSRTGHAKALEQNLADFKEQNSNLRKCIAAKEAELAVVRAELEAFRRMQARPAFDEASGHPESHPDRPLNLPHEQMHKKRLLDMQRRLLNRTIAIEEVWAEVKLGEERVRILSAIAQASETHVKILQEELCKAHAETAAVKDDLSEQQRTINEQIEAVAASAGAVAKIRALEASAKEDTHLVAELRKRLKEAEAHLLPKVASKQQQQEEAQGVAAVAAKAQETAVQAHESPAPACSPPVVQAQHSRSPVPRIWQSAQTDLPEANLRRSAFFSADPKQASLTSAHEAALSSHRGSAEHSGSLRSNAVVTTTFIVPSSSAQPASSAPDSKFGGMATKAAIAEVSPGGSERAGQDDGSVEPAETCDSQLSAHSSNSRGEKRDVRGVSRVEKPAGETASKKVPLRRSVYTPVKLQDMTQLGPTQRAGSTPGSSSARGQQPTEEDRWTPLSERRSRSSPASTPDVSQAPRPVLTFSPAPLHVEQSLQVPMPARSPLSEMQLPPVGSHSKPTPEHLQKGSPVSGCVLSPGQAPTPETCMSPLLRFTATPGSAKGEPLRRGPKHAGRGLARKAPTPKASTGRHAAGFRDGHATPDARKHALPELEASLCNLHGSPLSPPDTAADKAYRAPAISSLERPSALGRDPHGAATIDALQSTAASSFQAAPAAPPFSLEQQPQSSGGAHRARTVLTVQGLDSLPGSGSPLDSPALMQGASTPRARGARPRVPSLNLSGSLRISMEAITPPCSFPLRGHAAEPTVTDRHLSTSSARSHSSEEDGGHFPAQAIHEQNTHLIGTHKGSCTAAQLGKQNMCAYGGWGPLRDGRREEESFSDAEGMEDCMPTRRSTEEAVYELGVQDDSKGSRILGETSTFLVAPVKTAELSEAASERDNIKNQGSGQQRVAAPASTPSKAEAGEKQEPTLRMPAKRGASVFQRLSPLLKKKGPPGESNQEVTPRERVPVSGETTPVKGLAKLSPGRWKWGCKSGKAAAANTCSPLRDGAAAGHFSAPGQNSGEGSSPQKGGRRRLSSAKLAPWLGR